MKRHIIHSLLALLSLSCVAPIAGCAAPVDSDTEHVDKNEDAISDDDDEAELATIEEAISDTLAKNCVKFINQKRQTLNPPAPPLKRAKKKESCVSTKEAPKVYETGLHYEACGVTTQCACPRIPAGIVDTVGLVNAQQQCLQKMWDEGWGGVHYNIMADVDEPHTKVACGFYLAPNGDMAVVQDYL